jgi:hypothetical protein
VLRAGRYERIETGKWQLRPSVLFSIVAMEPVSACFC